MYSVVYIFYSSLLNWYYIGFSGDERLRRHNSLHKGLQEAKQFGKRFGQKLLLTKRRSTGNVITAT